MELLKRIFHLSNHTLPVIIVAIIENMLTINKESKEFVALGQKLKEEMHKLLGEEGVFLYPTHPEAAPKHKTTLLKFVNTSYTAVFNILEVPITQCPLGFNKDGLPLGVQVVAGPRNDHLSLAVAQEIGRRFGGWVAPCKIDCTKPEPERERKRGREREPEQEQEE
jgi:fatty acid amide hydrolase 2